MSPSPPSRHRPLVASVNDLIVPPDSSSSSSSASSPADAPRDLNVVESYEAHLRQNPRRFMEQLLAAWNGQGWRGYTDYIGAPILIPGQSQEMAREVMTSESVQSRIKRLAACRAELLYPQRSIEAQADAGKRGKYEEAKRKTQRQLEAQLMDIADQQVQVSIGRLDSLPFIKVFAAAVNNILTRMYHQGIHLNIPQVLELRKVAAMAAEKKQSIIFLPCHKSHIDYLTVSWLLFRVGLSLPAIVAGENLDLPVVGNILRGGGAFFIRRTFSGDQLYPVVIREYIERLLSSGRNMECFIEGTRSRTGKLLPPKLGILKYVLEAMQTGRTNGDVWICPISLQYDSVIESETYVSELLGKPKESESLFGLLSGSSSLLSLKLGRIDVRFHEPWSLQSFVSEQHKRREAQHRVATAGVEEQPHIDFQGKDKMVLLKALGYRVLADINRVSVVMPAALVGTVLLTLRGRGVGRSALERKVDWLRAAIEAKGYAVADFGQMSTSEVVERALGLMRPLVEIETDVMEETILPAKRFELSFYRNQVIHVFVNEALLCAALYTKVKQGGTAPMQTMSRAQVLTESAFLSGILRNEFVYGTEGVEVNVDRTIDALVRDKVLQWDDHEGGGDDRKLGLSSLEREQGRESFDSYLFLIWPFVESYWLACCSLLLLAPPPPPDQQEQQQDARIYWYNSKTFSSRAQLFGKTLYQQGELAYLEAINIATLSQALQRFEEIGLVLRRKSDSSTKPVPLIALAPEYRPRYDAEGKVEGGRLWEMLERLSGFRREGKERRENLLGERVMRHVRGDGSVVVEVTTVAGGGEREGGARL